MTTNKPFQELYLDLFDVKYVLNRHSKKGKTCIDVLVDVFLTEYIFKVVAQKLAILFTGLGQYYPEKRTMFERETIFAFQVTIRDNWLLQRALWSL